MTETAAHPRGVDRRTFLGGAGALVVAIGTPLLLDPRAAHAAIKEFPIGPANVDPKSLDAWIAVKGDGTVLLKSGKEELGQGMATAVAQMLADELDVPFDKVELVISDTWQTVNQGGTSGSNSSPTQFNMVRDGVPQQGVRRAAAEARAALLDLASKQLGEPVSGLSVRDGVVTGKATGKQVSYAALIGDKQFNLTMTGKAQPKRFQDYKLVGTSVKRVDIPAKVFGKFTYNQDVRLPGMVHARLVRPPTIDSKLVAIQGFERRVPGLVKVVVKNNFVAVVAEREEQAIAAATALKVKWDVAPLPAHDTIYDTLVAQAPAQTTNRVLIDTHDVDASLQKAAKVVSAEYRYPIQMHGPMGASAAQAWVQGNTAVVWTHTQNVYNERAMLATALDIPAQNIRVIYVQGSGVYGMTNADGAGLEAAIVSQAVGRPVKLQYMRADDHTAENYGQPYVHRMRAGLDGNGQVTVWDGESWSATRGSRPGPPANLPPGVLMGFPEIPIAKSPAPTPSQPVNNVDGSNSTPHYVFKSQRMVSHSGRLPFFSAPLRSPNRLQNTFANESFIDELAHAAGADPIAYRLEHLRAQGSIPDDPHDLRARLIDAIERNVRQAKWTPRPAASKIGTGRYLTGRGVAAMVYEGDNGINSSIWQVTVDTKTGKVVVDKCWSVQDCGPVINPTGMRMQAEGSLMQGTSRTLIEELKWTPGGVTSHDWATYPVIRFNRLPEFELEIVDRPEYEVMGAGEVLITNAAAGIANAIFDATGVRLRQVPFTPARVRAALKQAGRLAA
jgi:CO/xanthine dehydrogenase Mo-binding subunit